MISFGGTDSQYHYNDTWTFDTASRIWGELHCIGFIPSPREGHSAALVDDVVYVYGGRGVDGKDLGDLGAFKISSTYPHATEILPSSAHQTGRRTDHLLMKSSAALRFRSTMVHVPEYGTGA